MHLLIFFGTNTAYGRPINLVRLKNREPIQNTNTKKKYIYTLYIFFLHNIDDQHVVLFFS